MNAITLEPVARQPPAIAAERDYISFSAIKMYTQCPLKYFFRYIAGLPEQTVSSSLVFGSAIHHAIDLYFVQLMQGSQAPSVEQLVDAYKAGWSDHTLTVRLGKDEQESSFTGLAERMLTAFVASDLSKPLGRILAVEEQLRGQVIPGLPDVLGRVDLIVETEEELVITDWKTSRSRYTQEQVEESAAQLLLYGELVQDFAPGKRLRLEFGVLTKTKDVNVDRHSFLVDRKQVDRTKRIVERVWDSIEAEHFYPVPSTMNCPGCPYKETCRKWPG